MNKKRILIIDDSEFERTLLRMILTKIEGTEVVEVDSAEAGLEVLGQRHFSLVMLDFNMPGLKGDVALLEIRQRWNALELPVIMFTGRSDDAAVLTCLKNGANDYLVKPIIPAIAASRVELQLRLTEVSQQMTKLAELSVLDSTIAMYNHEINNPLAIAIGLLGSDLASGQPAREKLEKALWRVAKIVKDISRMHEKRKTELKAYLEVEKRTEKKAA